MQTPTIAHIHFLILSALIDGREKRLGEIGRQTGLINAKGHSTGYAANQVQKLFYWGFIEKTDVVAKDPQDLNGRGRRRHRLHTYRMVRITDAGRQVWQETLDFYLFVSQHVAEAGEPVQSDRIQSLSRKTVPPPVELFHKRNKIREQEIHHGKAVVKSLRKREASRTETG